MGKTDQLLVQALRVLSIDMIEKANSGHPGLPMGAAPMASVLFKSHLKFNPAHPEWFNRDRFILSAGHGSSLLYSLLHVFGYDVSTSDLQQFRQLGSKTPGHPEYGVTPGVDVSTGPLGQGIAMAVGMAMAEAHLAAMFNRPSYPIVDHYTYALCGDGCLMEGISYEAASLAGHLGLGKLILLYDSNHISLDGSTSETFTENVQDRFRSLGWETIHVEDGNDLEAIDCAIRLAKKHLDKPTLIEINTIIGYGSPNRAGTSGVHGTPLGRDEARLAKAIYNWGLEPFELPDSIQKLKDIYREKGSKTESAWLQLIYEYGKEYPELYKNFDETMQGKMPDGWDEELSEFSSLDGPLSTRDVSGKVLNALNDRIPTLFGGSADLSSSNNTILNQAGNFSKKNYAGKNIWFGVREFSMGAILNGIMLHGGLHAFGGTFFVFSDYLRSAIRSAALMKLPVIYIMTHDSIAVGEDGPTHQPVEQLASYRAMPGIKVIRPADANETVMAYRYAVQNREVPVMLVLSRQALPIIPVKEKEALNRGAYILADTDKKDVLLVATGSEVSLALKVKKVLETRGIGVRVVSMPCMELFESQTESYQNQVISNEFKTKVAIEMGAAFGWKKYADHVIAVNKFGASGNAQDVMDTYGFSTDKVIASIEQLAWRGMAYEKSY
ncbi:transketolase [Heyndrickxia acidiproducens]|uniref:transketolase n=1 Tax=Heyndrickxia acidiproducens TaxID=1121084 RepID=UPI00037EBC1D|nr:transketolase [Heyndrickxia acidiproducens]